MTRRAGYSKRVEQAMRDLLGVFGGHRVDITPAPRDPLPVGVAARLALLVAATDPAVLTGGMRRGSAEDQKARRESLAKAAVADVPDLLAHVGLPVRCGGRLHAVLLREDDTLWLPNHPGLDPATERIAAALGAPLLPCVRELDGASRCWSPPVADDGPRSDPIGVGELLAFVLACRSWLRRGHALAECVGAVEQGIAHGAVVHHLDLGLSLEQAVDWAFVPAADALRWATLGFRADDARVWLSQGRTLEAAEAVVALAGEGRWLARWARVAGRSMDSQGLAEWAAMGLPVGVWGEIASRGVRASDANRWLAAGFSSVEVLRYAHLRVGIDEALRWRGQGFTGFVAAGCLGVGMTLEDACELRGLPTREVQDAWRTVRSVEGVRAMVSP